MHFRAAYYLSLQRDAALLGQRDGTRIKRWRQLSHFSLMLPLPGVHVTGPCSLILSLTWIYLWEINQYVLVLTRVGNKKSFTLMLLVTNLTNTKVCKKLKIYWNPGTLVLSWDYSVRAFQWILKWPGLGGFRISLVLVLWNGSSLSIGRVKCHRLISIRSFNGEKYFR